MVTTAGPVTLLAYLLKGGIISFFYVGTYTHLYCQLHVSYFFIQDFREVKLDYEIILHSLNLYILPLHRYI